MLGAAAAIALVLTQADYDDWRYVPARIGGPAAAEFSAFRVTCRRRGELDFTFRFSQSEADPQIVAETGIELYLVDSEGEDIRTLRLPARTRGSSAIVSPLKLTPALAKEIAEAPNLQLYAENGPTNRYIGGRAQALRRLVRECART